MRTPANPKKQQMMLEENIHTLIPKMAVPPIVAQLITTIYNIVDTFFVSTLGTYATAAVGVNSSLERTITLIGSLLGAGACSYIARLLGAQRNKDADHVLSTSFFVGLGLGFLLAIFGCIFIDPLVYLLGATTDSARYAKEYATCVLLAAPFMTGSFIINMCMRSEGSATYAMIGIASGGILNCFLDPLFIYTFNLGVAGASMATAISKLVSFCILVYPYIRKRCNVHISVRDILFRKKDVAEVLSIGSTSFFRTACSVVSNVVINHVAGSFSTAAQAAISIGNRIMEFPFAIILGFGQGYQPVAGFNWGAKQPERVKESLRFSCLVSECGSIVMGAILFFSAGIIVPVFNKQADPEVLRLGVLCVQLQCFALPFHGFDSIINMFYSGIGRAKQALLMSTARQGYIFIPVAFILPALLKADGVAATQAVADVLTLAVALPLGIKAFKIANSRPEDMK